MAKSTNVSSADIKIALAKRHSDDFFLTEVKSGSTFRGTANRILDACAMKLSYTRPHITGYEIKVTRSDFLRDNKFFTYLPLCHTLYIVTPTDLVKREELPTDIGLMYYDPVKKSLSVKKKPPPRKIEVSSEMLQYIIYSRLDPERIPFYSSKAEYWRMWLDNKLNNQDLGLNVKSKLLTEIARLERELKDNKGDKYDSLMQCMVDHGMPDIYVRTDAAVRWLSNRLNKEYPEDLDYVEQNLQMAITNIQTLKKSMKKEEQSNE